MPKISKPGKYQILAEEDSYEERFMCQYPIF